MERGDLSVMGMFRQSPGVESGVHMPTWGKAVLRTIGVADGALTALGAYWLFLSVRGGVFSLETRPETPYFRIAFALMIAINGAFLVLFAAAAFQLFRLSRSGVMVHAVTSALLIAYSFLVGMLWLVPHNIGRSIGAATGVGNMGVAPFELLFVVPYVYPIASTVVLLVIRRKMPATHAVPVHPVTV